MKKKIKTIKCFDIYEVKTRWNTLYEIRCANVKIRLFKSLKRAENFINRQTAK